ncbi:NAD(P)-binding protein [Ophiobolus disseminans]|uniref:NAD(P)-binding protein n=1 Tax=Ophiobolus disseminans TaxID=1469910 RepID=A0A6A7A3V2_9PLEO|nr:NAD(P)-binding protein [Ophiobolus disseminans]
MSKLLVVFGATGQQGKSVIEAVLGDEHLSKEYSIRGTTRDTSKPSAQQLAKKGVEIVEADVNDTASLEKAFKGAHIVFAYTATVYDGHAYEHEVKEGRALADAVVAADVPFLIYSTLPNGGKISGGKLKNLGHFDGKEEVEQYMRTLPVKTAFFAPGTFMSNFGSNMTPHPMGDGTYGLFNFVSPNTKLPLINTAGDTGKWIAAILSDFPKYEGKVLCAATALYSLNDIVDAMGRASGKSVAYIQIPEEKWRGFLPPTTKDHLAEMFQYIQDYGYYGSDTEDKLRWSAEQAHGKLTTIDEYLQENPLQLA